MRFTEANRFEPDAKDIMRAKTANGDSSKGERQAAAIKDLAKLFRRGVAFARYGGDAYKERHWIDRAYELGATDDEIEVYRNALKGDEVADVDDSVKTVQVKGSREAVTCKVKVVFKTNKVKHRYRSAALDNYDLHDYGDAAYDEVVENEPDHKADGTIMDGTGAWWEIHGSSFGDYAGAYRIYGEACTATCGDKTLRFKSKYNYCSFGPGYYSPFFHNFENKHLLLDDLFILCDVSGNADKEWMAQARANGEARKVAKADAAAEAEAEKKAKYAARIPIPRTFIVMDGTFKTTDGTPHQPEVVKQLLRIVGAHNMKALEDSKLTIGDGYNYFVYDGNLCKGSADNVERVKDVAYIKILFSKDLASKFVKLLMLFGHDKFYGASKLKDWCYNIADSAADEAPDHRASQGKELTPNVNVNAMKRDSDVYYFYAYAYFNENPEWRKAEVRAAAVVTSRGYPTVPEIEAL